jgi:hypothetical protein
MTTIVNNPTPSNESGGGGGFVIGAIILIVFVAVLLYFGIPAVKNMQPIQLNVPAPEVTLPENINVNVTQPQ